MFCAGLFDIILQMSTIKSHGAILQIRQVNGLKEKRFLAGITALVLCLAISFSALGEIQSRNKEEKGKIKETVWTDEGGNPAAGPEGYASVRYTYTRDTTTERYYDKDGQPYETEGGYYGRTVTKDGKDRVTEIEFLDRNGKRTLNRQGYAQVTIAYTGFGGIRQISYTGLNRKLVTVPSLGYASVTTEYSGKSIASQTFKDTRGKPVDSVNGYAVMKQKLNKKYQVMSIRYDHADGSPATGPDGWFRCVKDRDGKGRVTSVKYYDVNMNLIDRGAGYAWEEYSYEGDRIVKTTRHGLNGEVITDNAGIASTVREMKDDKVIRERFLDKDGKRVSNELGVAEILYGYDAQGRLETVSYCDTDGNPANCTGGYARYRDVKDDDGITVIRTFLGADGQPTETSGGYSEIRYVYDETKQLSSTQYYDLNGNQIRTE